MENLHEIKEALVGLYVAAKYKNMESVQYRVKVCDNLDITNFAQNLIFDAATKDKTVGTNDSTIYKIMEEAGDRLLGRSIIYQSILVS